MPAQLQMYSFADLWHPWVLAWIALLQVGYLLLVGPIREGFRLGDPLSGWQKLWFSIGLWIIYLSEGTPMHVLAEKYLFSIHMVQHVLLTMVLPALLLMGTPEWGLRPLLRWRPVRAVARTLTHWVPALLVFNLIYSLWHMPLAYQATLWWHYFHMFQHTILVFTAFCMWMPILSPTPALPRLPEGMQMVYIFLIGVSQIAVFGIITFADGVLYDFYAAAPRIWPVITPKIDQEIAGVVMKLGGMGVMVYTWLWVFFRWANREGALWDSAGRRQATNE